MKKSRTNRRKAEPRQIKIPRIKINVRWLVVPPAALGALAAAYIGAQAALSLPVTTLELSGTFQRLSPLQVEAAVAGTLDRGFLGLDLRRVEREIESLDWVDTAKLARKWPDTLAVRIVEHQAAARWGERGLLNARGELFTDDRRYQLPELPVLSGPSGSEHEVAERYLVLRDRLAAANLGLAGLAMDERGAWRIDLDGGQRIRLGKSNVGDRLDRFFAFVLPALAGELDRVRYVDMRYTNGFAVAWIDELELSRAGSSEVIGGA
jgi:cell division protein FtsQ